MPNSIYKMIKFFANLKEFVHIYVDIFINPFQNDYMRN